MGTQSRTVIGEKLKLDPKSALVHLHGLAMTMSPKDAFIFVQISPKEERANSTVQPARAIVSASDNDLKNVALTLLQQSGVEEAAVKSIAQFIDELTPRKPNPLRELIGEMLKGTDFEKVLEKAEATCNCSKCRAEREAKKQA